MPARFLETPMNADVTPMNADNPSTGGAFVPTSDCVPKLRSPHSNTTSSAFIGVTSAFIGVPKNYARITPALIGVPETLARITPEP